MPHKKKETVKALLCFSPAILIGVGCILPPSFLTNEAVSPFLDVTATTGIEFKHQRGASDKKHLVETMGSGCALLDYDSDGLLDVLLINGGTTPDSLVSEPVRPHAL